MERPFGALALVLVLTCPAIAEEEGSRAPEEKRREPRTSIGPTADDLEPFRLGALRDAFVDVPSEAPLFQLAGIGMVAASAADLATTEMGLSSGLREANPMASHRGARVLHHVVGPAAVWWTTEKLKDSGRTKLALSLRLALMAAYGYATLHNARKLGEPNP